MNEVNGGDNDIVFVRCVSVCLSVCVCVRSGPVGVNSSKTVKATDFKFDTRIRRDNPDMTPQKVFPKVGATRVT